MENLAKMLHKAYLALDPERQGLGWPNPVHWDGRPLDEQARDVSSLLDAKVADLRAKGKDEAAEKLQNLSNAIWDEQERLLRDRFSDV